MEETTKDAVIQAAFELLKDKDMNSISIREIANKAGVNVATVSYYFGGKAQLFDYLMQIYWADLIELCQAFLKKDTISKDDAYEFCRRFLMKQMNSTCIIRSEQIMYHNYEIDVHTKKRLEVQFAAFHKLVTVFYNNTSDEKAVLAKIIFLLSALTQPAYWNEIANTIVGDLDSFIELYIKQLVDDLSVCKEDKH